MRGWFIAALPGRCTDCGTRTSTGARVLYPADQPDTVRLCVDCGTAPADLLEVLAQMDAAA